MSSKDNDEERVMHSRIDNVEVMINDEGYKVIEEHFQLFLSRYQIAWEPPMKGSDLIFDCIELLYGKCHMINYKYEWSYLDSSYWNKTEKQ